MINFKGQEYEVLGDGVCYGYLPKIGSNGLMIIRKLYDGKWHFNFSPKVQGMISDSQWFQTWDGKDWEWFHGSVDKNGKITQIG